MIRVGTISERLLDGSVFTPHTGCRLWVRCPSSKYPQLSVAGVLIGVHRLAYEVWVGEISEGMYVCHHCDTPRCIAPAHLFLGTPLDNMRDMAAKGRKVPREKKFTDEEKEEIRMAYADGHSLRSLAQMFQASRWTITRVCRGEGAYR